MSNQEDIVLLQFDSVENAVRVINENFAYGEDLDQAIAYLKEHDPQNDVLKAFMGENGEVDVELLRAMNASAKHQDMKKIGINDPEEFERIANILNVSKNSVLRGEAMKIFQELANTPEQAGQIEFALDEAAHMSHQNERNEFVRENTPSLSDDEMEENADRIVRLFSDADFQQDVLDGTVNRAKEEYEITDEDGNKTEEEKAVDFWGTLNLSLYLRTQTLHVDDAGLKDKSDEDLKQEIIDNFWGDVAQMAEASGSHDKKHIKANAFFANFFEKEEEAKHKAEMLKEQGKTNAANRLQGAVNSFMDWSDKHLGTNPVRMAKTLWGYFSSRRGITNTLVGVAPTALALLGITTTAPAIAAAMVTAGAYFALSPQRWTIEEKRRANLKAAKEKGNEAEIRMWSGLRGYNNARKAIKANEKENARYQRQRKWAWGVGGLYALAGSVIAPFAFGAEAAKGMIAAGATVRASGGTANAGSQWYEAAKQNKEDKTEESAKAAKLARTYFVLGAAATTLMEVATVSNLFAAEHANEVATNPNALTDEGAQHGQPVAEHVTDEPVAGNDADAASAEATSEAPEVVVPDHYSSDMGISENQWNNGVLKYGHDIYEDKFINVTNAQEANPDMFVHADGSEMTQVEVIYKSQAILEGLAKKGADGHAILFDENHQQVFAKFDNDGNFDHYEYKNGEVVTSNDIAPECWGNEERVATFRAIYRIVDCGDKDGNIDAAEFNRMYATVESFRGNGNGAYAIVDRCGDIQWKVMHHHVAHHAPAAPIVHETPDVIIEQPAVVQEVPVTDNIVNQPVEIHDVKPQDHMVDDGAVVATKVSAGRVSSHSTQLGQDANTIGQEVRNGSIDQRVIPGSAINIGREVGGR